MAIDDRKEKKLNNKNIGLMKNPGTLSVLGIRNSKTFIAENYEEVRRLMKMEDDDIIKIESLRTIPEKNKSLDEWKYEITISYDYHNVVVNYH